MRPHCYPLRKCVPARADDLLLVSYPHDAWRHRIGTDLLARKFQARLINDSVAFVAVLVVATSGIVGRYFYSQIHRGLYGRKAAVGKLSDAEALGFTVPSFRLPTT
jgi:hypothetical protein